MIAAVVGIVLFPNIAAADNCSGLGDCFDTQSALLIALAVLLIVLAVALVVVTAPVSVPAIAGGGSALALTGGAAALTTAQFATYVAAATAITIGGKTIYDQSRELINDYNTAQASSNWEVDGEPIRGADKTGKIAGETGLTDREVRDAIHGAKPAIPGAKVRNPDVVVDLDSGEIYPKVPGGGLGDSIGNIFD